MQVQSALLYPGRNLIPLGLVCSISICSTYVIHNTYMVLHVFWDIHGMGLAVIYLYTKIYILNDSNLLFYMYDIPLEGAYARHVSCTA